jgi:NADPH-dependent 2,4-dienoyl-CoA reductase/sulfur reductase-like enzyme
MSLDALQSRRWSSPAVQEFIIIGNGVAGTHAALALRHHRSPEAARITLISDEAPYFFSRTALMYAFMDRLERRDLEPIERHVYDELKIERIQSRALDLDASAHTVTLANGRVLPFDRCLLATGARPRTIPFDRDRDIQDGLVHFVTLSDLDACERLAATSEQAVVVGGGLIGIELVECLLHHGLDVTFLVREPYFWPAALSPREGQLISRRIRDHGVRLIHDQELAGVDIDAAGRVSAVHTTANEALPAQLLGICVGVSPRVEWLESASTPPRISGGLVVDPSFSTSLPHVFGAGDCVCVHFDDGRPPFHEPIWYTARDQGRLAALSMLDEPVQYDPPVFYNSSKFFDVEYTTVGSVNDLPAGSSTLFRSATDRLVTQRIAFDSDRRVLGFSMLGSRWDHRVLIRWIHEQRSVDYVREHLASARFDVEFGGVDLTLFDELEEVL